MSEYVKVKTKLSDEPALIEALIETGRWTRAQIEVHQQAQTLYGYHNDPRPEKAHIIIRRQAVGSASNDIGFERTADGSFVAHISQYDRNTHGDAWLKRLTQNYAFHRVRVQQEARGRQVTRERLPNGRQRLTVRGYR